MTSLVARDVVKYFMHKNTKFKALGGINLDVDNGEIVSLIGPSGCGKSTFLRLVAGLDAPDEGVITFEGETITGTNPDRIMVFQEGALFPWLNVQDNVEFGLRLAGIPAEKRHKASHKYLDMMHLTRFTDSYIHQLSTGMKQRVAIARALVMEPRILLMDEPFSALDMPTRDRLLMEVQDIWAKTHKTILFVTHNAVEASVLGSRIAVFSSPPSHIKKIIKVDHRRPRTSADPEIQPVQVQIREELEGLRP